MCSHKHWGIAIVYLFTTKQHTMKLLKRLPVVLLAVFISLSGAGQVSPDSISLLKQQKQSLELSSKINEKKLKLAKLENEVDSKNRAIETTAEDARKKAAESADAAARLPSDPQNKKLGKNAKKSARDAERAAKKARDAVDNLASLRKDIESLRNKIADDEKKLAANPVQQ
jgi:predicted  nucleic acid-binding Zn-ribbon protein